MEKQLGDIHEVVDKSWKELDQIWRKIGYDATSIAKRKGAVLKHTQSLFSEMVEEAAGTLGDLEVRIRELYQEILQLLKDLSLDNSLALQAQEETSGKTLLEREKGYEKLAEDLRAKKAVRMEKYNKVNDKLKEITEELDEELFTVAFEGIPSDPQVGLIEQKFSQLQKEKVKRQNQLKNLKKSITTLFQCLERIPRNQLERLVSLDDYAGEGVKILSSKTLASLDNLNTSMKKEVEHNREEAERLREKIRSLWSRLAVGEEIQAAFEKVHRPGECHIENKLEVVFKPSIIKGMECELARLEEEKKQNMALFIGQVREELSTLWTQSCFMTESAFRFRCANYIGLTPFTELDFRSDLYDEDLLDKHEVEVDFWRSFVERNRKLIDLVGKREELFLQYKDIDEKSDDPARLSNRGGALLKLEKERKALEKSLPKMENEMRTLASTFSSTKDGGRGMKEFLVFGQPIAVLLDTTWQAFREEKERRKELRKGQGAGGKTMNATQAGTRGMKRPGTPGGGLVTPKRARVPGAATPSTGSSAKTAASHKLIQTPGGDDHFARPATRGKRLITPAPSSTASGKAVGSRIPGAGMRTRGKEQINPMPMPAVGSVVVSPAQSYSEFTDHLLGQSTLNSSAVSTVAKGRKPLTHNVP